MEIIQGYVKEIIALVVFLSIVFFTIYMAVKKKIDTKLTSILLAFSIPIGFAISNYNLVKKLKWMGLDIETFEKGVTTIKEKALEEIRTEVENHRGSINLLIRDADKARVDLDKVEELSKEAKIKVDEIGGILEKANEAMVSIRSISEFSLILIKASNDDRSALDVLFNISASNNPFAEIAFQTLLKISRDPHVYGLMHHDVNWDIDVSKASLEDFMAIYNRQTTLERSTVLETVWAQERFSKYDRLEFLFNIVKTTESNRTLYKACKLIDTAAKLNCNYLWYRPYLEWWGKNKDLYKGK